MYKTYIMSHRMWAVQWRVDCDLHIPTYYAKKIYIIKDVFSYGAYRTDLLFCTEKLKSNKFPRDICINFK